MQNSIIYLQKIVEYSLTLTSLSFIYVLLHFTVKFNSVSFYLGISTSYCYYLSATYFQVSCCYCTIKCYSFYYFYFTFIPYIL